MIMPLPKALLCVLGDYSAHPEESKLRQAGFATAVLHWKDLAKQTNDWMQLAEVLEDTAVQAWVIAGEPAEFTEDVLCMTTLLALSLRRKSQPGTAFVLCGKGPDPILPPVMGHVKIWQSSEPFAARLMAARFKPGTSLSVPFHIRALLNPMIGLWLEIAPADGQLAGFTAGVLEADIRAFGVGPLGAIPNKSRLAYPVLGAKGTLKDMPFSACAAQNELTESTACYCKVDGLPRGVFLGNYLDETEEEREVTLIPFTGEQSPPEARGNSLG